jgi:regulator of replication initiation timing
MDYLLNPDSSQLLTDIRIVRILSAKAEVLMNLNGDYLGGAYQSLKLADYIVDNIRLGFREESSGLLLGKEIRRTYETAVKISYKLYEKKKDKKYIIQAFRIFEKSKSAILLNKVIETKAKHSAGIPDSLLEKERNLKMKISSLQVKLNSGDVYETPADNEEKKRLLSFKQEYLDLIKIYEEQFPLYYKLKYNPRVIDIAELRNKLLKSGETYIQYFLADDGLYTILISREESRFIRIPVTFDISDVVASYRTGMVESKYQLFASSAYKLYQVLIDPVKEYIAGNTLIIVPDGILSLISFDTLIDTLPDTSTEDYKKLNYLVYKFRISYAYSCSLLKENISFRSVNDMNSTLGFAPY